MAKAEVLSHWSLLIEGFETSALGFYTEVEEAVTRREIPDVELSRVDWKEGGVASAKREYLRVRRGQLVFDICASPFGNAYFFSWWMARIGKGNALLWAAALLFGSLFILRFLWQAGGFFGVLFGLAISPLALLGLCKFIQDDPAMEDWVLETPWLGGLYERIIQPSTYYKRDTATMFQESVRRAVMEVIGGLREEKGLRALSDNEERPQVQKLV